LNWARATSSRQRGYYYWVWIC